MGEEGAIIDCLRGRYLLIRIIWEVCVTFSRRDDAATACVAAVRSFRPDGRKFQSPGSRDSRGGGLNSVSSLKWRNRQGGIIKAGEPVASRVAYPRVCLFRSSWGRGKTGDMKGTLRKVIEKLNSRALGYA